MCTEVSPSLSNQPSRSGLKKVWVRSPPSSSGMEKGSLLMLSNRFCQGGGKGWLQSSEYGAWTTCLRDLWQVSPLLVNLLLGHSCDLSPQVPVPSGDCHSPLHWPHPDPCVPSSVLPSGRVSRMGALGSYIRTRTHGRCPHST